MFKKQTKTSPSSPHSNNSLLLQGGVFTEEPSIFVVCLLLFNCLLWLFSSSFPPLSPSFSLFSSKILFLFSSSFGHICKAAAAAGNSWLKSVEDGVSDGGGANSWWSWALNK